MKKLVLFLEQSTGFPVVGTSKILSTLSRVLLKTQDGKYLLTQGSRPLGTQDGKLLKTLNGKYLITEG